MKMELAYALQLFLRKVSRVVSGATLPSATCPNNDDQHGYNLY